jgi:6-phosphogluconate dehydrogenase
MMSIGFIGLGRMGKNMILHLLERGVSVVAYNRTSQITDEFADEVEEELSAVSLGELEKRGSLMTVYTIKDLIQELSQPRIIFLMVKAGEAVDCVIDELLHEGLSPDDIVIDGGNSFYEDSIRRFNILKEKNIHFIDCGTSGGLEGARHGACLMLGGEESLVESLDELWNALGTWNYFGVAGAGHFVKMVHNGVEYGMNQALAEGFALLEKSDYNFDLATVAKSWSTGSVVRGWLVELLHRALMKDPKLENYKGTAGGGQTGRWAIDTGKKLGVAQRIAEEALRAREASYSEPNFAGKVVSALRYEYGGHVEENRNTQ